VVRRMRRLTIIGLAALALAGCGGSDNGEKLGTIEARPSPPTKTTKTEPPKMTAKEEAREATNKALVCLMETDWRNISGFEIIELGQGFFVHWRRHPVGDDREAPKPGPSHARTCEARPRTRMTTSAEGNPNLSTCTSGA
jgi:hypothetical protein